MPQARAFPSSWLAVRQAYALTKKNCIIRLRSWQLNLLHILQVVLLVFLVWAIDKAISYSNASFTGQGKVTRPHAAGVPGIPDCRLDMFLKANQQCHSFLYSPAGDEMVEKVVTGVLLNNNPPLPTALALGLANMTEIEDHLWLHPQAALAALHFIQIGDHGASYIIQTNASLEYWKGRYKDPNMFIQVPLQVAVERELAKLFANDSALHWDIKVKNIPHPSLQSNSIIGRMAPVFILASLMFNFVSLLTNVVAEKETGIRASMTAMGLCQAPYWASWIIPELWLGAIHAALLCGSAAAFGFDLVLKNDFALMYLLVLLTDYALMGMCLLFAVLVRHASSAVPLSFGLFIIAWVLQLVVNLGFPFKQQYHEGWHAFFSLFPWTLLSKGIMDLGAASTGTNQGISWQERSSYCLPHPPHGASAASFWMPDCVLPLTTIYWVLLIQAAGYTCLALYLEAIIWDGSGMQRPPWFCFLPSFWFPGGVQHTKHARQALKQASSNPNDILYNADVSSEAETLQNLCKQYIELSTQERKALSTMTPSTSRDVGTNIELTSHKPQLHSIHASGADSTISAMHGNTWVHASGLPPGVHIFGLRKVFPQSGGILRHWQSLFSKAYDRLMCMLWHFKGHNHLSKQPTNCITTNSSKVAGKPFVALYGTWMSVPSGQCLALLGPNGAGKSTTIKCLIGALAATQGDAVVWGHSIRSAWGLEQARRITGVCPQFDILWPELTGREHLHLFAHMKAVPCRNITNEAASLLEQVKLTEAADRAAGRYSGGMRRRLSVAVALLGNPKVLYLDEPTTGMDPVSRRHVWELISRCKAGRSVLLTTHSMEEADILGDRIAILAQGRLRCLGNGLHLKGQFGNGYMISISIEEATASDAQPPSVADSHLHSALDDKLRLNATNESKTCGRNVCKPSEATCNVQLGATELASHQEADQNTSAESAASSDHACSPSTHTSATSSSQETMQAVQPTKCMVDDAHEALHMDRLAAPQASITQPTAGYHARQHTQLLSDHAQHKHSCDMLASMQQPGEITGTPAPSAPTMDLQASDTAAETVPSKQQPTASLAHRRQQVQHLIAKYLGVSTYEVGGSYLHFQVPKDQEGAVLAVLEQLQLAQIAHPLATYDSVRDISCTAADDSTTWLFLMQARQAELGIQDVQVVMAPLEHVYLNVVNAAEQERQDITSDAE